MPGAGFPLPVSLAEWLAQATAPLREAPFSHEIVLAAQQLPLPHRDPADRFLAATAQVMDLALVTSGYAAERSSAVQSTTCRSRPERSLVPVRAPLCEPAANAPVG
jgi:PIN domain nuclease of toxin-antitoxin system